MSTCTTCVLASKRTSCHGCNGLPIDDQEWLCHKPPYISCVQGLVPATPNVLWIKHACFISVCRNLYILLYVKHIWCMYMKPSLQTHVVEFLILLWVLESTTTIQEQLAPFCLLYYYIFYRCFHIILVDTFFKCYVFFLVIVYEARCSKYRPLIKTHF